MEKFPVPTSILNIKKSLENYFSITEETWQLISKHLTIRHVRGNEVFIEAGRICHEIFFINKGITRFFYFTGDIEVTSCFNFQDSFISALSSCIQHKPSVENAQAIVDTELIVINYNELLNLYDKSHTIERLGRLLVENAYIELENRLFSTYHNDAKNKYLNLLKTGHPDIIKKIPLKFIASYLGITPETLSRIRKKILIS